MRKRTRTGVRSPASRLALIIAALLAVRILSDRFDSRPARISDSLGAAVLAMELPGARLYMPDLGTAALTAALPGGNGGGDGEDGEGGEPSGVTLVPTQPVTPGPEDETSPEPQSPEPAGGEPASTEPDGQAQTSPDPSQAPATPAIGTTITGEGGGYTASGEGIYLKNRTDYDIDVEELLNKPFDFSTDTCAVLIVHTHGSEAYNPAGEDIYEPSDPSRTEDRNYNVVRVGDELEKLLTGRGITVYHDRELHDYPSYAGSYERTLEAINAQLDAHPEISVVIDLHRDALEGDGKVYKTVADIGDTPSAQVMLICGSNFSGLKHPDWRENLSFALKLQRRMVDKYPTLARPLKISEYRYNQHATKGSLIAEVGTNGNTLQEALTAVRYFGDCLADVLTGEK